MGPYKPMDMKVAVEHGGIKSDEDFSVYTGQWNENK